jgi:hypothetical protein
MKPWLCFSAHSSVDLWGEKIFRTEAIEITETRISHSITFEKFLIFLRQLKRSERKQQNH